MWPFVPHAVLLTVSDPLEHEKILEYAVTASFRYSIQNLKDNSIITDLLQENCPLDKSKEPNSDEKTGDGPHFHKIN